MRKVIFIYIKLDILPILWIPVSSLYLHVRRYSSSSGESYVITWRWGWTLGHTELPKSTVSWDVLVKGTVWLCLHTTEMLIPLFPKGSTWIIQISLHRVVYQLFLCLDFHMCLLSVTSAALRIPREYIQCKLNYLVWGKGVKIVFLCLICMYIGKNCFHACVFESVCSKIFKY